MERAYWAGVEYKETLLLSPLSIRIATAVNFLFINKIKYL